MFSNYFNKVFIAKILTIFGQYKANIISDSHIKQHRGIFKYSSACIIIGGGDVIKWIRWKQRFWQSQFYFKSPKLRLFGLPWVLGMTWNTFRPKEIHFIERSTLYSGSNTLLFREYFYYITCINVDPYFSGKRFFRAMTLMPFKKVIFHLHIHRFSVLCLGRGKNYGTFCHPDRPERYT